MEYSDLRSTTSGLFSVMLTLGGKSLSDILHMMSGREAGALAAHGFGLLVSGLQSVLGLPLWACGCGVHQVIPKIEIEKSSKYELRRGSLPSLPSGNCSDSLCARGNSTSRSIFYGKKESISAKERIVLVSKGVGTINLQGFKPPYRSLYDPAVPLIAAEHSSELFVIHNLCRGR